MKLPDREPRPRTETTILHEIRESLNARPDTRIFRNNVGKLQDLTGRWVQYGLSIGSPDLIGMTRAYCPTCGTSARFVGVEVKTPGKRANPDQRKWFDGVAEFCPVIGVATDVESAHAIVERVHAHRTVHREG